VAEAARANDVGGARREGRGIVRAGRGAAGAASARMRTLAVLVFVILGLGCEDPRSVGLPCVLEHPPRADQSVIESPSLDCDARLCLQVSAQTPAMCTAECETVGEACTPASTALCAGGFRCAVPFDVGAFAGRKLCVCGAEASGS
jgi:hypothetical protein